MASGSRVSFAVPEEGGDASPEMDNETAKRLMSVGGTVVLLDVPAGTEVGIDVNSWNAGPNFKGIKMIPPGIHFVYWR